MVGNWRRSMHKQIESSQERDSQIVRAGNSIQHCQLDINAHQGRRDSLDDRFPSTIAPIAPVILLVCLRRVPTLPIILLAD